MLYTLLGYTFIILNDMIAIVIQTEDSTPFFGSNSVYEAVCRIFLGVFDTTLLAVYVLLYVLFIRLIYRNDESFGFMKFQVHSFFIFMILIQLGRQIVGLIFKHDKS